MAEEKEFTYNTTNLNLSAALVASGLRLRRVHAVPNSQMFNFILYDLKQEGGELADMYFDRTLTANVRLLFDARALLINAVRQLRAVVQ